MASRIKFVVLILVSLFFTAFGVLVLISAYRLGNPFEFIITFFAANFIILISAALCVGFIIRLIHLFRPRTDSEPPTPSDEEDDR